jgi:hypothetical protein
VNNGTGRRRSPAQAYAQAGADAFAPARDKFEQIVSRLRAPGLAAAGHGELEEFLRVRGRDLLLAMFQGTLDELAEQEEKVPGGVIGADGLVRRRVETGRARTLITVFGDAVVTRCAYKAKGLTNVHPLDKILDLPVLSSYSHGIARIAVIEGARGSFAEVRAAIERITGVTIGTRQLRELMGAAAVDIEEFHATAEVPEAEDDDAQVLTFDAKGVVMRLDSLREATAKAAAAATPRLGSRLSPGEKTSRKRMAELACVYDIACEPRTAASIIAVTPAEKTAKQDAEDAATGKTRRTKRPKATHRWLSGSLIKDIPTMVAAGFAQADRRDPSRQRPWVALVDGNRDQITAIDAEAAARGLTIPIVIDFVHVVEYVWNAAWAFFDKNDPTVEGWVTTMLRKVLDGNALQVAAEITEYATRYNFTPAQRKNATKTVTYLTRNNDHLDYPTALRNGWPIATGVIEGACRHLVCDRLDITGARWGLSTAEAVLTLRATHITGNLDAYWKHHRTQQHARNYPDNQLKAA